MSFFSKNKFAILGSILAALTAAQQFFMTGGNPNWLVVGFALAAAIASFLQKNLTGQGVSIAAIISTLVATAGTQAATGKVQWGQLAIQAGILIVGLLVEVKPASKIAK